jgi:hypothetical protein
LNTCDQTASFSSQRIASAKADGHAFMDRHQQLNSTLTET